MSLATERAGGNPLWVAWAVVRTLYCWIALALLTLVVGTLYIAIVAVAPRSRILPWLERFWVNAILFASHVRIEPRGMENVRPGHSYIVMANHRSMYDIPVIHRLLSERRDLRWIGKQELARVPVFGWAFALSRHVTIDRQNREKGIAALKRAAAESAEGVSFMIMPEGTRSRDGRLLPFKKGGFHLAIDTGLPILPMGIEGTGRMMRKGEWWILSGTVRAVIRPAVPVDGLDKSAVEALRDRVRKEIEAALETAAAVPADSR